MTKKSHLEILEGKLKFFSPPGPTFSLNDLGELVVRELRLNLPNSPWVWKGWELLIYSNAEYSVWAYLGVIYGFKPLI